MTSMPIRYRLLLPPLALVLRQTAFAIGGWRVKQWLLAVLRQHGQSMGERVVRLRHGFRMKLNLRDWLGQIVYVSGVYEAPTADVISKLLKSGDTVVDVGANVGFFSLLAAHLVGPDGRVLAFEPAPSTRQRLRENVALNDFENIKIHDVALSNVSGTATFHEGPESHIGISSLRSIAQGVASYTVSTASFDEIATDVKAINLVKIDVEGAEQLVCEGMRASLMRDMPHVVMEVTDDYLSAFGHTAATLCGMLLSLGYRMYKITEHGLLPIRDVTRLPKGQYNALFTTGTALNASALSWDA